MTRFAHSFDGMKQMLAASQVELTEAQVRQLWTFHQLLRERNADGDLTRLRAFESMVTLHYVDCIYVAQKLGAKLPSPLLDIGSGAGFPGIPLKIALPDLELILAEGRVRRIEFMNDAIELLDLKHIQTWHGKVWTQFPLPVQGTISRALEKIPVTLQRVRHFVPPGGLCVFMKGPHCDDEIAEAKIALKNAFVLEDDLAYRLPFSTHDRRLVTFRRLDDPTELIRRRTRMLDSEANESFRTLKSLLEPRGVRKDGSCLIAGKKLVPEVLRDFPHRCLELLVPRTLEHVPEDLPPELTVTSLAPGLFKQLDVSGTNAPLLRVRVEEARVWTGEVRVCVLAVPFQDPENVGAVLRSAAAFGVTDVILTQEAASPWSFKALRAGGSAALRLNLWKGGTLQEVAAQHTGQLVTLSAEGTPLDRAQLPENFVLLPGVEGPGLPKELRTLSLAIPMAGGTESLNAATATAIALYVWSQGLESEEPDA